MNNDLDYIFKKLSLSKFRSSFHLDNKDIEYIKDKGIKKIEEHAYDFVSKRLDLKKIKEDGKQTPMRGHHVFKAQHATGTCCRGCLYKWHHIDLKKELNEEDKRYIVRVIMKWIDREWEIVCKKEDN